MNIKIDTLVVNSQGDELEMSFPSEKIVRDLPKDDNGKPNRDMLPRETVQNMLLNCLATYQSSDKKEIFSIFDLGQRLIKAKGEIEISDEEQDLLVKVVEKAIYKETTTKDGQKTSVGIYRLWGIAQLYKALGVQP